MNDYQDIIDNLPKPYSAEEQYLYSIACVVAEVPYEIPFQNAFWRKEQYLKAIWQIAIEKVAEPTVPSDGTVTTDKIFNNAITEVKLAQEVANKLLGDDRITTSMLQNNSVTTDKIADNNVTENKLSKDVSDKLLGDNRIITSMIQDKSITLEKINEEIEQRLLGTNRITEEMLIDKNVTLSKLSDEVRNRLLDDDKIQTNMIKNSSITTEKIVDNAINSEKIAENTIILKNLSKEVTNLLLSVNHVGIIQQPQINQITESGDTLTLDVLKNKINEIIQLLNNAEITK